MKLPNKHFFIMIVSLFVVFYILRLSAEIHRTEVFLYSCNYIKDWGKIFVEKNKDIKIYREYVDSNYFLEYGYFSLDSATHYSLFKKENGIWYFKESNNWKVFYFDGITKKDTIIFYKYNVLTGPYSGKDFIWWSDTIYRDSRLLRVFDIGSDYRRYIFDKDSGIVGIFENNPIFSRYLDTCWRDPY